MTKDQDKSMFVLTTFYKENGARASYFFKEGTAVDKNRYTTYNERSRIKPSESKR